MSWFERQLARSFRWTDFTPEFSSASGTYTPTVDMCEYMQIGDMVFMRLLTADASTSIGTAYVALTIPVPAYNYGETPRVYLGPVMFDIGSTEETGSAQLDGEDQIIRLYRDNQVTITTTSMDVRFNLNYRAA